MSDLKAVVEALIFASPEPLTVKALARLLDNEPKEDIVAAVDDLRRDYDGPGGLQMVEVAGGFQIVTRPELHEWVRRLFHERTTQKLSVAALETLAVVAYRQPVTAPEIAEIRGVNTAGVVGTLVERKLIKIVGRKQVVGRPFLYGTTREFLERFGLNDLSDLPKVEDMSELLGFDLPATVGEPDAQHALPFDPGAERPAASPEGEGAGDAPAEREVEVVVEVADDVEISGDVEVADDVEVAGDAEGGEPADQTDEPVDDPDTPVH